MSDISAVGSGLTSASTCDPNSNIMRVTVHPKYRTIGLGQKLVRETLPKCETPYAETTPVMARYNPFFGS